MTRIITVFGATGQQGSSVVDSLLEDGTFSVRAVSRNVKSEASEKLKARGVEVVQADLLDVETVKKAIAGSEGIFGVTNFWDPSNHPNNGKAEIQMGKNLVDAAKEVGIKFFVFSSLPSAKNFSNGKYIHVDHCESKYEIEEYLRASGVPNATLYTSWFAENLWNLGSLQKTPEGNYLIAIPRFHEDSLQEITWAKRDVGTSALALFKHYHDHKDINNGIFNAIGTQITYGELAKTFEKALGKPVSFMSVTSAGMVELDEMFDCQIEYAMARKPGTIPDPRLIALGAKFSTMAEFAETEIKKRFA